MGGMTNKGHPAASRACRMRASSSLSSCVSLVQRLIARQWCAALLDGAIHMLCDPWWQQPACMWQVPLVEGVAFEQFVCRVRRRLGLPDQAQVTLRDAATGAIDSIDRLLEVDEGSTLEVISDMPSCLAAATAAAAAPTPMPTSAAGGATNVTAAAGSTSTTVPAASRRPMAAKPSDGSMAAGPSAAGGQSGRACRVDIPVSEWARGARGPPDDSEEGGDLKYRKRRGAGLTLERVGRWVCAFMVIGGLCGAVFRGMGS